MSGLLLGFWVIDVLTTLRAKSSRRAAQTARSGRSYKNEIDFVVY
jgi:hypothetical protein